MTATVHRFPHPDAHHRMGQTLAQARRDAEDLHQIDALNALLIRDSLALIERRDAHHARIRAERRHTRRILATGTLAAIFAATLLWDAPAKIAATVHQAEAGE